DNNAKSLDLSGSWFRYVNVLVKPWPGTRKVIQGDGCFELGQNKSKIIGEWYANNKAQPMAVKGSVEYWMPIGSDGYVISLHGQRNVTKHNKTFTQYVKWIDGFVVSDVWQDATRIESPNPHYVYSVGELEVCYVRFTNKTCMSGSSIQIQGQKFYSVYFLLIIQALYQLL
uniref:Uncharacterized protein n=1 Tax=Clytia hemisphaerica TaxID=252671 RepID=A0A7M5WV86_9CNID